MPKNKSLLVYLTRNRDGNFVPAYREDPGGPQYLEEIVGLCETKIAYPENYSETKNKEVCPEPYQYDDCVPIPTFKTSQEETSAPPKMDETGTAKMDDNNNGNGKSNNNNMKEDQAVINKNNGKGTGQNGDEGEAAYESVKTSGGGSNGGDVDSSDNTENKEGEEGFDPDGSMATLTFNIFVPLAMLTVWFVLV